MVDISFLNACTFTFDGVSSDSYNLIICWIDDKPDVSTNGLSRKIESGTVNHVRLITNNYGTTYDGNIKLSFGIIKKNHTPFTRQESMAINNWLTGSTIPKQLSFNDEAVPSIHYYAVCTQIEDKVWNDHYAKKIVFETNSPFGFMNQIERKFVINANETFKIENEADTITGIYYPDIEVSSATDDDIVIENISDGKSVTINLSKLPSNETGQKTVRINNRIMKILDVNSNEQLIPFWKVGWDTEYSSYVSSIDEYINKIYWFRLIRGENTIKVSGDCTINFVFEFPRKVGCL